MSKIIDFIEISNNKKIFFYFFTILWIVTLLTALPFLAFNNHLLPNDLLNSKTIQLIQSHESTIIHIFSLFLLTQLVLVILRIITLNTKAYEKETKTLLEFMTTVAIVFLLLMQLSENLDITSYGWFNIILYYAKSFSITGYICFIMLLMNMFFLLATIFRNLFQQPKSNQSTSTNDRE